MWVVKYNILNSYNNVFVVNKYIIFITKTNKYLRKWVECAIFCIYEICCKNAVLSWKNGEAFPCMTQGCSIRALWIFKEI